MRLRAQTVCFTGHRLLTAEEEQTLTPRMDEALELLYQQGMRRFFSGGAMGFDLLAAERVAQLQKRHADVRLLLAIPHPDQTRGWEEDALRRYIHVMCLSDETRVLSQHYYQGCMMVRNRYMVDRSALCLCYLRSAKGGTASTVAYALRADIPLVNLAMPDAVDAVRRTHCATPSE